MVVQTVLRSRPVRDYALITLGLALTAYGLNAFLIPNRIAAGGVSGLATIVYHVTRELAGVTVPVGAQVFVMNTILLLIALSQRGLRYAAKTVYGIVALSVFIDLIAHFDVALPTDDLLLSAIYGGAVCGIGIGMVFKAGGNSGGTDIVAQLLARRIPFGVGQILFVVDAAVTVLAAIAFGPVLAMYGVVAIFIGSAAIDIVLEGIPIEKAAFIISERHDEIARAVLHDMGRGATTLEATGAWTGTPRKVLWVVLSRNEIDSLKRIVGTIDPHAMLVISNVHETIGEGFKEMRPT